MNQARMRVRRLVGTQRSRPRAARKSEAGRDSCPAPSEISVFFTAGVPIIVPAVIIPFVLAHGRRHLGGRRGGATAHLRTLVTLLGCRRCPRRSSFVRLKGT